MNKLQEQLDKFENEFTLGKGFERYFELYFPELDSDDITCMLEKAFKEGWERRYNTLTYHDL